MTDDRRGDVRAAVVEIRREGYKAAVVHASVEATCALLGVHLVAGVVAVPALDEPVAAGTLASAGLPAPDVGVLLAVFAGVVAFAAGVATRVRRPLVEQFEAANPPVREALRTARDAADADRDNPMAQALYDDVLDRLRETSSVGLVGTTRLAVTMALALALGVASVQTAVVGVELGATPGTGDGGIDGTGAATAGPTDLADPDLRDGDEVLGQPTNVSAGSENLTAEVSASTGGEGDEEWDYDRGGDGSDAAVDAERAGFADPERVEDSALVRRYARARGGNTTNV